MDDEDWDDEISTTPKLTAINNTGQSEPSKFSFGRGRVFDRNNQMNQFDSQRRSRQDQYKSNNYNDSYNRNEERSSFIGNRQENYKSDYQQPSQGFSNKNRFDANNNENSCIEMFNIETK